MESKVRQKAIQSIVFVFFLSCFLPAYGEGLSRISADTPLAIPDANTTGIISTIDFLSSGNIVTGEVRVNISHTYIGDLKIRLKCPSGTEILLHNRSGRGTDNLMATYKLDACQGQSITCKW